MNTKMTSMILIALEGKHVNYLNGLYLGSTISVDKIPLIVVKKTLSRLGIAEDYSLIKHVQALIQKGDIEVSYVDANHPKHGAVRYGTINLSEHFGISIRFLLLEKKRFSMYMDRFLTYE